ncbi:MAG: tetratricopeptide repeat protein, partial [Pyrinomonadaceae bacterium]
LGVKKNVIKARELFAQGAQLGDSWAQLNLGELYESGKPTLNISKGDTSPLPTSQSGNSSSQRKPNYAMARKLYLRSAARGNRVAAFKLGEMYEMGHGTEQDYAKALGYYRQSAAHLYAPAQFALGRATELGLGTPVNLVYAYLWYSLASAQGNSTASERLQFVARKLNPPQVEEAQGLLSQLEEKLKNN